MDTVQVASALIGAFFSGFMFGYYVGSKRENPYSSIEFECNPWQGIRGNMAYRVNVRLIYKNDKPKIVGCKHYIYGRCDVTGHTCRYKPSLIHRLLPL